MGLGVTALILGIIAVVLLAWRSKMMAYRAVSTGMLVSRYRGSRVVLSVLAAVALVAAVWHIRGAVHKLRMQRALYAQAQAAARASGRRLVVIGSPHTGVLNRLVRGYDAGDVCIDREGCGEGHPPREILPMLRGLQPNSVTVFESEVLELVDDMDEIVAELDRVAGPGHVFALHTICRPSGKATTPPSKLTVAYRKANRSIYNTLLGEGHARRLVYSSPPYGAWRWVDLD